MYQKKSIKIKGIEFAVIPSYPDYEASRCGLIRNRRNPRRSCLTPYMVNQYLSVKICQDGRNAPRRVHRLIAEAFVPNPDNKPFVNHKNGNKLDNSVSNLEWCTQQENVTHAIETGLWNKHQTPRDMGMKLSSAQVLEIRRLVAGGAFYREIADRFGISELTVGGIYRRESWKHLEIEPEIEEIKRNAIKRPRAKHFNHARGEDSGSSKLTHVDVVEIRRLVSIKTKRSSVAAMFGVTSTAVSLICRGVTWSHIPIEEGISVKSDYYKITEADVPVIRRLRADGMTLKAIGAQFGVNRSTIGYILRGDTWKHV